MKGGAYRFHLLFTFYLALYFFPNLNGLSKITNGEMLVQLCPKWSDLTMGFGVWTKGLS